MAISGREFEANESDFSIAKDKSPIDSPIAKEVIPPHTKEQDKCILRENLAKNEADTVLIEVEEDEIQNTQSKANVEEACEPLSDCDCTSTALMSSEATTSYGKELVRSISCEVLEKYEPDTLPIKTEVEEIQNTQSKTDEKEVIEPLCESDCTSNTLKNSKPATSYKNERVRKISREDLEKHKTDTTHINIKKNSAQKRPFKMNKKEAQIFLGKDSATITALIHSGTIPSYREGHNLYLHRDDLEIYKNEVAQNRHILMTREEALNFINVNISTLNILLRKGRLPIQRSGGRVFFFRQDLERYNNEAVQDGDTKLNIKEACIFLDKQRKTIYKLIHNGLIPSYIDGEEIFFFRKHLEEYKNGVARKAHIRLNVKGACKFLDRSNVTVYKLIRTGQIPSYKDGQIIILFQEHLEKYKTDVGLYEWVKMNKGEACDFLDIDRVSFKILCDNGAIPSHRDGKRLFFYHRDLARYKNEVTQLFLDR